MTVTRGLSAILSSGTEYITFEEGKPVTLLFIDWYEDVLAVREHYEFALNPKYIRCPGKDVCPLCKANPDKYPALRVKFRVYDPVDGKVKIVSLAKSHVVKLNTDFNLDEIDPTKTFVRIHRTGKGASDTSYSARAYRPDPAKGLPEYELPNLEELDMPDLEDVVRPHTPEEIEGFMNALLGGSSEGQEVQTSASQADAQEGTPDPTTSPTGRKLPF